jgi:hypothetical protein
VAIRELKPDAVCLSITHVPDVNVLAEEIGQISRLLHNGHGILIAGGRGATLLALGVGVVDAVFTSCKDLLEFITQMHRSVRKTSH